MAYDGAQAGTRLAGSAPGFVRIVVLICALIAADPAFAGTVRCPDWNVAIHSADSADAGIACEAAEIALGFLSAHGIDTACGVEVHLVDALPALADPKAFGCYDQATRRAYMLVFPEFLIAPFRFAAEAYRHFLKPGNGKAFLAEVLAGRALLGEDGP